MPADLRSASRHFIVTTLSGVVLTTAVTACQRVSDQGVTILPTSIRVAEFPRDRIAILPFTLTNTSTETATIGKVEGTCSCTVAEDLQKTTLLPGETVTLRVRAAQPSFGGTESTLKVHWKTVRGAGLAPALIQLDAAPMKPPFLLSQPFDVQFTGQPGETLNASVEISTVEDSGSAHWVDGASFADSGFKAALDDVREQSHSVGMVQRVYRFRIQTICPPSSEGDVRATLTFAVSGPSALGNPLRPISVTAHCEPLVRATPDSIVLDSTTNSVDLVLTSSANIDWASVDFSSFPPWVDAQIVPQGSDSAAGQRIRLTWKRDAAPEGWIQEMATIRMSLPDNPNHKLEIKVSSSKT